MPRRGRQLTRPLRLLLAALAVAWACAASAEATYVGTHVWRAEGIGGISGLEVAANGIDFVAISDRARLYTGQFSRRDGRISGVTARALPILKPNGEPTQTDSEGLALGPDGRLHISFEGRARVWSYDSPTSPARPTPRPRDWAALPRNTSLEALAVDTDGTLVVISEGVDDTGHFPLYRLDMPQWRLAARIVEAGRFAPVGADFGPDGLLYLLERRFSGLGFQSRVRRIDLRTGATETLLRSGVGEHGNLEGIAIWQDDDGALRLTMVSDDNFLALQRTEFVEYRLDAGRPRP